MKKFRILSIDGGGLRGVIPVTILKKVEELTGQPIWQSFDLIAGTSTGGLIACAATLPKAEGIKEAKYSLDEILNIYTVRGKEIFPPRTNWFSRKAGAISDATNPKYNDQGIDKVFSEVLGTAKMKDSLTNLLITSYDLSNNIPLFFKTRSARKNPAQNILQYHVCRATSAAPTYLPAYEFNYPNDDDDPQRLCIDGGVFINNPSLGALAEFSKNRKVYMPDLALDKEIDYDDVYVLSVGTGSYTGQITAKQAKNKGLLFWASRISEVMMRGVNRATDYEMLEIMEDKNYLRLTIDIENEKYAGMDDSSTDTIEYIINKTKFSITENSESIADLKAWLTKSGLFKSS